ncbi:MAG: NAD(P)-dependent oxidoreductase [Bacteroidetes bacterium]|nr:NAD(P)-dependent oxidoreductase [Bacteroidota bacterium]
MKAFHGMGLLGSNFVQALMNKGENVQVWNRTYSRAKEMEQYGARAFSEVADAVRGVDIIHLTLRDDASVDDVLQKARPGFSAGVIIVDHTTTTKSGAIKRTLEWEQQGFVYQHAPVFMGPINALQSTGFMLVSGNQAVVNKLEPYLSKMTGQLINFGDEAGKAAAMKLIGNCFLVAFTAGLADALALGKAMSIPVSDIATLFASWNPGISLQARLRRMTEGDYDKPSWELNMARKDTGLFLEAAQQASVNLTSIPAIASLMDEWITKGYGKHDWTVIAKGSL